MRKIITALLLFALSFLSCAPKPQPKAYPDRDPRLAGQFTDTALTDEGCFWRPSPFGDRFYYFDTKTGTSGVLCNKPECDHTDVNKCDGGAPGTSAPSLALIDDRLYWIADRVKPDKSHVYAIYSMRTDSTDRKYMHDIELPEKTNPQRFEIHRGFIYIYSDYPTVDSAKPTGITTLLRVPLEGGEAEVIAEFDKPPYNSLISFISKYHGDDVYFLMNGVDEDGRFACSVFHYNTVSNEFDLRFSLNDRYVRDLCVDHDGELFVSLEADDELPAKAYRIENGSLVPYMDFDGDDFFCDSIRFSNGIVFGSSYPEGTLLPTFWIKSFDGSTLYKGELPSAFLNTFDQPVSRITQHAVFGDASVFYLDCHAAYSANGSGIYWKCVLIRYEFTDNGLVETLLCSAPAITMGG